MPSASQKEVALTAGTVRYLDVGEGPVILFVHGFLTNSHLWFPVVERLRGQARCIVPDWPLGGHSVAMRAGADLSQKGLVALIAEFVDALSLDNLTLVGNDMGGALSQQFVAAHPGKVARLVLTPCDVFDNFPPGMFKYLVHLPQLPYVAAAMAYVMRIKAMRRLPVTYGLLAKHGLTDDTAERFLSGMIHDKGVRGDAVRVIADAKPAHLLSIRSKLEAFDKPVDIVWPREEKVFPFTDAEILAKTFPNARLTPVDNAYTFVSLDQPDAVAAVLKSVRR